MAEKIDLIANRSMTYMTRRLLPEEPFQAKAREARVLVAIGKARPSDAPAPAAFPEPKKAAPAKGPRQPRTAKPKKA